MTDIYEKLACKKAISRHLSELGLLLGRRVEPSELLTLQETKLIQQRAGEAQRVPVRRYRMRFDEKTAPWFQEFVGRLAKLGGGAVYLWTPTSNVCGLIHAVPLLDIQLSFPFSLNVQGILVLMAVDLDNHMLLDFWDDEGTEMLDVEVAGGEWERVAKSFVSEVFRPIVENTRGGVGFDDG